jgi:hypothetical protein
MSLFSPTVKVKRTIFPYPDGWGVVIEQAFKPDTITDVGLTKKDAEHIAKLTRQQLKGGE